MRIQRDNNGQPYIQWQQVAGAGGYKRAWIQRKSNPDKNWANAERYLNVVRTDGPDSGPSGNATDFPIFSSLPDEDILKGFVAAVCAITGCHIPDDN